MNTIFSTEGDIGAILVIIGTILILCTRFEKYGFTCTTTGFILLLPVAAARVIKDACAWNYFIFYTNIIYSVFCVLVNTLPGRKEKKKVKKERTRKIKKRKKRVVKKNRGKGQRFYENSEGFSPAVLKKTKKFIQRKFKFKR